MRDGAGARGFLDALDRMDRMLRELIDEVGPIEGIGVGCPGPLSPVTGELFEVSTLPGWRGANLVTAFEDRFGGPVALENDADAAALAEFHWGTANSVASFIYITISTGIGGGIILNKELYRGVSRGAPRTGASDHRSKRTLVLLHCQGMLGESCQWNCHERLDENNLAGRDAKERFRDMCAGLCRR